MLTDLLRVEIPVRREDLLDIHPFFIAVVRSFLYFFLDRVALVDFVVTSVDHICHAHIFNSIIYN